MSQTGAGGRDRGLGALVASAVAIAGGVFAYVWFWYLPAFNTPHTALAGVDPPPPSPLAPRPPLARRLVVMVIDGLGWDDARGAPALDGLRAAGSTRLLAVEFPSYTYPALTALVTGVDTRDSGVRLNGDWEGAPGLQSVPGVAGSSGVPVSVRTRGWKPFELLMRPPADAEVLRGRVERFAAIATARAQNAFTPRRWELPAGPGARLEQLVLEYVDEVDDVAHQVGKTSPRWLAAVDHAAAIVAHRMATMDLGQDALVVLSDHGHRLAGGHGGVEPESLRACFFAAGPGLRRGAELPPRPMRDVASTLSLLGGLHVPSGNTGRPMLDLLDVAEQERARLLAPAFAQQARWLCRLHDSPRCAEVTAMTERLGAGDPAAPRDAEQLSDALWSARATAEQARADSQRIVRIVAAAVAVAIALVGGAALMRRAGAAPAGEPTPAAPAGRDRRLALAAPAVHVAIYATLLLARGHRPTFSALPPMADFLRDTFITGAIAAVFAVLVSARPGREATAGWALLAVAAPYALLAAWVGCDPRSVPPPVLGVLVFHAAPAVLFAGIAALLAALLGWRRSASPRSVNSNS